MGNVTSASGINGILENNETTKTPLNKFIDKVISEKYFLLPEYNDNSIAVIEEHRRTNTNITDEHRDVMLKRAYCSFRDTFAIDLPSSVDGITLRDYSVNINVVDQDGEYLPSVLNSSNLQTIVNSDLEIKQIMCCNLGFQTIDNNGCGDVSSTTCTDGQIPTTPLTSTQISQDIRLNNLINELEFSLKRMDYNSSNGLDVSDTIYSSNIGGGGENYELNIGSNACNVFYYGSTQVSERLLQPSFYGDPNLPGRHETTYGGFGGKVLLQNRLNDRDFNNPGLDDPRESSSTRDNYIVNNYDDCNCLNGAYNMIDNLTTIEGGNEVQTYSNLTYTQGIDTKCSNDSYKGKYNLAAATKLPAQFCLNLTNIQENELRDSNVPISQSCNTGT